ncbi:urease accessory protein [Ideonella sp. YS5]|uniref:urease accessory protein n=1 Tax=Ideonella sp. YS5 TaxID=3453714 RepID=UPI003EEDD33E
MTALSVLLIGLLLGLQHATEADHLAAVATLATRSTTLGQALRQGVAWGVGHTLTLLIFAGAMLVLGQAVSPAWADVLETAVGLMLVALGIDVLRRLRRERIHFHLHEHPRPDAPALRHFHAHSHRGEGSHAASTHRHAHAPPWPFRALLVGVMHGLAGSAALVLLSLQAAPGVALGLGYIALFGLGSIGGMALLSVAVALPLRASARHLQAVHHVLQIAVSLGSIGLGAAMVGEIGWLPRLLGA